LSRNASKTATDTSGRARHGLFSRSRDTAGPAGQPGRWICPECGLASHDRTAARLGFCDRCSDFTGMCGAGRKIVCPDMMTVTSWHTPCTNLGAVAWQISQGAIARVAMICPEHDGQLRAGNVTWVRSALPLAELRRA
jgi:ribosomal protein L37AE/L43A